MLIKRLLLRNYRVYEDQLELELPSGLVGVYGPNGAGKSYLIESLRWTLYGRSRSTNDDVRTDGVGGECLTEVEFEHEGHLYLVRRVITPGGAVRALALADGLQVAEGAQDTGRYVRSILGMDDASFRASVFAEQNQVAAFSGHTPAKRKDLVLRLLGITPLDRARDGARRDARLARDDHDRLRSMLPDLATLEAQLAETTTSVHDERARAVTAEAELVASAAALEAAEAARTALVEAEGEYRLLVQDGRAAAAELAEAGEQVVKLEAEVADLDRAEHELARLAPVAEGLQAAEVRLAGLEAVCRARRALEAIELPPEPALPDDEGEARARAAAASCRERVASLRGGLAAALAAVERAREAAQRSVALSGDEPCPVCGQELGDAFERVRAHRATELHESEARLADVERDLAAATAEADAAAAVAKEAGDDLVRRRAGREAYERARALRAAAEQTLAGAIAAVEPPLDPADAPRLASEADDDVARRRQAHGDCQRLAGKLERRVAVARDLLASRSRAEAAASRREALLEKVKGLGFDPAALAAAHDTLRAARRDHEARRDRAQAAHIAAASAAARADGAAAALDAARAQHAHLAETAERARHLGRVAELLAAFRESIVATVGPRLSAQAADLFAELTDHEYDRLEVDPESYDIQIRDGGRLHGMDRFSGSETDLANLALRVAISEHVRFQSGGQVGLLVLDEVFGPLDADRKARMLLALERLRARFRQVLVVTHDVEIKEQLPSAIEVVKLAGRRATARVL